MIQPVRVGILTGCNEHLLFNVNMAEAKGQQIDHPRGGRAAACLPILQSAEGYPGEPGESGPGETGGLTEGGDGHWPDSLSAAAYTSA